MDKGIYTALSGGIAKNHELELVANNLANANTPGFKRDTGTFNEYLMELRRPDTVESLQREIVATTMENGRPPGDKSFVEMDAIYTNHSQGTLAKTGRTLDMALEGNGYFEVLTPAGIRYTRQGNFSISPEGRLVTVNGFPVLASARDLAHENKNLELSTEGRLLNRSGAAINTIPFKDLPPENRFIDIEENGPIQVTPEGHIYQGQRRLASISIDEFHENQWLEKSGNSYFRNTHPENVKIGKIRTQVHQGFLEGSNVNPVAEMTKLIEVSRAYESHMQAIKTYQDMDSKTVNDIARER